MANEVGNAPGTQHGGTPAPSLTPPLLTPGGARAATDPNGEGRVVIPEGRSGRWSVERYTVSAERAKFDALRASIKGSRRGVPAGTYTRLMRDGDVIMSDTPDELRDLSPLCSGALGSVLITGLGLGVAAQMALAKPEVSDVTVVEISPDVISLVGPHLACDRLTIVEANALTWVPPRGRQWHMVWHDIWDYITADNLPEMQRLHRRYARRAVIQRSWGRGECERAAKRTRSWRW